MTLRVFAAKFRLRFQGSYMDQAVNREREGRDQFTRRAHVLRSTGSKVHLLCILQFSLQFYVILPAIRWARKASNYTTFVGLLPQIQFCVEEQKVQRDFRPAVCSGLSLCSTIHPVELSNQKTMGLQHDRADRCVSTDRPIPAESTPPPPPPRAYNELQDGN